MAKRDKAIFRREHLDYDHLRSIKTEAELLRADIESANRRYKKIAATLQDYTPKYMDVVLKDLESAKRYLFFGGNIELSFCVDHIHRANVCLYDALQKMEQVIITIEKEENNTNI